jgi:hypothetical protein
MASYLLTFPTVHDGDDVARIMDATDTLAEADSKGRLLIWYSDITSAFYRTIIELDNEDDDLLDDMRKAGWTIEPAPAGVYCQRQPIEEMLDLHAIRIVSDGGKCGTVEAGDRRLGLGKLEKGKGPATGGLASSLEVLAERGWRAPSSDY